MTDAHAALRLHRARADPRAARPRAPHRHRRRRHVGRRPAHARARPAGQRLRRRRQPHTGVVARQRCPRRRRPRRGARRRRRHRRRVVGDPRRQRRARRRPRRGPAGAAPLPGPRVAHGRSAPGRRRRCQRQDHHHVDARRRARRRRGRPVVRLGRRDRPARHQRRARRRPGLRRRGRRERRLVPRLPPRRRRRHERAARPPRPLRHPRGRRGRLRRLRRVRRPTADSSSPATTTTGRVGSPRRHGAAGRTVLTYGHADGRRPAGRRGAARRTSAPGRCSCTTGVERVLDLAVPGDHNVMDAAPPTSPPSSGLGADPEAVLAGLAGFGGARRRFEVRGEVDGVTVVDDYAHNPAKVAAVVGTASDIVQPGRARVAARRVPAAPVLPHPRLRGRLRPGAGTRPTRSCSSTSTARASNPVEGVSSALVGDPLRALPGQRTVLVGPTRDEAVAALVDAARPGDLVLTVGAGDVTALAPLRRRGPAAPAPEGNRDEPRHHAPRVDDHGVASSANRFRERALSNRRRPWRRALLVACSPRPSVAGAASGSSAGAPGSASTGSRSPGSPGAGGAGRRPARARCRWATPLARVDTEAVGARVRERVDRRRGVGAPLLAGHADRRGGAAQRRPRRAQPSGSTGGRGCRGGRLRHRARRTQGRAGGHRDRCRGHHPGGRCCRRWRCSRRCPPTLAAHGVRHQGEQRRTWSRFTPGLAHGGLGRRRGLGPQGRDPRPRCCGTRRRSSTSAPRTRPVTR